MKDTILYSCQDHIGHLVLNNPRRHNSLGREQLDEIAERLTEVAADPSLRVLLISGAGEKTFCAGASLSELNEGTIAHDGFQKMTGQLSEIAIPTICAMNGDVFGGGVELAVSCDFRIGVEGSRMQVPAAAIGLCYPMSGIERFVRCLGPGLTKRLLVAAEEFSSSTMLQIGFLDHVVPATDLQRFAYDYAKHIAGLAPLSVRAMKQILQKATPMDIDAQQASELVGLCLASQDLQEGFAAKRERRKPQFNGR
jgi:enoyl-CoA hydratase/carnithine racemase